MMISCYLRLFSYHVVWLCQLQLLAPTSPRSPAVFKGE
jgi:hypothetical protein